MSERFVTFFSVALVALGISSEPANADGPNASIVGCEALKGVDLSATPDAITLIRETKFVAATESTADYCEADGIVAPKVGFVIRLPNDRWNGKFIEIGCGGTCGTTEHVVLCDDPVRRGYACIVSDGGTASAMMKWAYNNPQAVIDYFVNTPHLTALAGKAIVEHFYANRPDRSYFMGCSSGGIQALWAAQRFPWDFDGIVAGAPALNLTGNWMNFVWINRALTDQNGKSIVSERDLDNVHAEVVAKCDLNDGAKDGVIGDPRECHFDPAKMRCEGRNENQCLTDRQIDAVRKVYGGPTTSAGQQIVKPIAMKGSEQTWLSFFSGSPARATPFYDYIGEWFRYYFFQPNPGPSWQPQAFDFDRDYKRLGIAEVSEPVNSQDLRRFKARGGRLLVYTGWNDALEGVLNTVDYYETAERIIGSRADTQDFFRLFMIPGMNHCSEGDGPFFVDYLSYIEDWVEKGEPPTEIIGAHLAQDDPDRKYAFGRKGPLRPGQREFSRPVYPYPTKAKYRGNGDTKDAANFVPVQ